MTSPELPPSYQEANHGRRAIPLIVQLHQHAPGRIFDEHYMVAGRLVAGKADAILLPTTATYSDTMKLLHERVLARVAIQAPSPSTRFFCRIALEACDEDVLMDQQSWRAARELLQREEGVRLVFAFSLVPRTQARASDGFCMKLFRKLSWSDYDRPCLIEPGFPADEHGS